MKDRETIVLSFPGASIAFTEKVWAPFVSSAARVVYGELQAVNGLESIPTDEGRAGLVGGKGEGRG